MSKKSKKLIKYTDREFNSIKDNLVEYAKRYYPNIYKDFSEASFGSLMLDTVAYVGDMLSFYIDYQANESFIDTAVEYDNVLRLGEQVGYRPSLRAASSGVLSLYIMVPSDPNGTGPDMNYLPILAKNTRFTTNAGDIFTLIDDVDFSDSNNEVIVATESEQDGSASAFVVKAYGRVLSGELKQELINVGDFTRFLTVAIADENITEIVSVTDSEGHEYFEVPFLSQDTIFRSVINKDSTSRNHVPNVLVATSVPRRFVTFVRNNKTFLKFGYGSDESIKVDNLTHPSNVIFKMHGKDYVTDSGFDPSKLLENDKFGIAPTNTTLNVVYRANTSETANTASNTIVNPGDPLFSFPENAINKGKIAMVRETLECTNETPVTGDIGLPTINELKQRINDLFATQNRAVTEDDYRSLIYRIPPKFGKVKRARIIRDHDSFKRNLNLYVISEDNDEKLITSSQVLKNNLKVFLQQYKMVNDTMDILDARVANFGINFTAVVNTDQDKFEALNIAINTIKHMFSEHLDIGQPIYITKIYDVLNNLEEIVDVTDVEIIGKTGARYSDYSLNFREHISADGRIQYAPNDVIYELKYPNLDIKGTIK